jgi:RNA polymerase sigma-70 factor, ECF subfamily
MAQHGKADPVVASHGPAAGSPRPRQRSSRAAAASGDIEAFYAANVNPLTLQLFAYTGNLAVAEDLVHEAFCRALPRWDSISSFDDPVAWVRRVAWNLANSRWRRLRAGRDFARRQREVVVAGPDPNRVALTVALAKLPANQRRAVVLHHLADLSTRQIAEQEGVAEGTVRVWLHRGRTALSALLDDSEMNTGTEHRHA